MATSGIAKWIRTFGDINVKISDRGSHFKNKMMIRLAEDYRIRHRFYVAYSPWVNETVESVNKHTMAAYRALCTELSLGPQDWTEFLDIIQSALNETPLPRLGKNREGIYLSPLEVMTGISPRRTLLVGTEPSPEKISRLSVERTKPEKSGKSS